MAEFQLLVDDVVIKTFPLDKAVTSIGRLPTSDMASTKIRSAGSMPGSS